MQFGVCCPPEKGQLIKSQGWDYVEANTQDMLQGTVADADWKGAERAAACPLPIPAMNVLVPATHKITGPEADIAKLRAYMTNVLTRAKKIGTKKLVFGSAGARNLPDGFDRNTARKQILEFLSMAAPIAQDNGVTIVIEPLNRGESNILNSVGESLTYVRELNHPNIRQLVDTYHFWLEAEPLTNLRDAGGLLRHVHVADKDGRVAPGKSGLSDYKAVFRILKELKYDDGISVEAGKFDIEADGPGVLDFLKKQWAAA